MFGPESCRQTQAGVTCTQLLLGKFSYRQFHLVQKTTQKHTAKYESSGTGTVWISASHLDRGTCHNTCSSVHVLKLCSMQYMAKSDWLYGTVTKSDPSREQGIPHFTLCMCGLKAFFGFFLSFSVLNFFIHFCEHKTSTDLLSVCKCKSLNWNCTGGTCSLYADGALQRQSFWKVMLII